MIVAKKLVPANNLKELIAWLKANPARHRGNLGRRKRIARCGPFSSKMPSGTRFQFVPYRGGRPGHAGLGGRPN